MTPLSQFLQLPVSIEISKFLLYAKFPALNQISSRDSLRRFPSTDFPQMFVIISPFFLLPFFFENCSVYSSMGFRNISHFSIMRLHRELLTSISGSFSWDNDYKFLSKCLKTIARKMLFSCGHLRNVRVKGAFPLIGVAENAATGGFSTGEAFTVILTVSVLENCPSKTFSVTFVVPKGRNILGLTPVADPPFHVQVYVSGDILPSSMEPDPSRIIAAPVLVVGLATWLGPASATGGLFETDETLQLI